MNISTYTRINQSKTQRRKIQSKGELVATVFHQIQCYLKRCALVKKTHQVISKLFFNLIIRTFFNKFVHLHIRIISRLNPKTGDVWIQVQIPPRIIQENCT